jgi:hypothetical protein
LAFGDQVISPRSGDIAGETGSTHAASGDSPTTNKYFASFDFWSVTGAAQPGLDITVSPDDGSGSRQSFISIEDNGVDGIVLDFFHTDGNHLVSDPNGGFIETTAPGTPLSYDEVHHVEFEIEFVEGYVDEGGGFVGGNDIVKLSVDGNELLTETTWESYYQTTTEGQTPPSIRAIDSLLFRISTGPVVGVLGEGFYFDNVLVGELNPNPPPVPEPGTLLLAGLGLLTGLAMRRVARDGGGRRAGFFRATALLPSAVAGR